jgi:hypothetical protein
VFLKDVADVIIFIGFEAGFLLQQEVRTYFFDKVIPEMKE